MSKLPFELDQATDPAPALPKIRVAESPFGGRMR